MLNSPIIHMTDNQFAQIIKIINKHTGISFSNKERHMIEYRLSLRIEECKIDNFDEYLKIINSKNGTREFANALNVLTNNETYFFREIEQLKALETDLLPIIQNRNSTNRRLSIWSAGCSSGEEVYSLAMLIEDSALFKNWEIKVLGTDISTRMLTKAKTGIYSESAFRNMPFGARGRFFSKVDNGWEISKKISVNCNFARLNLKDTDSTYLLGHFDIVLCRNVLIYFDKKSRSEAIKVFYNRLNPNGYLLLGHTETLFNDDINFKQLNLPNALAFQKGDSTYE